jgi:uncharacterized metal-binding protein YceD (DUF177 family)
MMRSDDIREFSIELPKLKNGKNEFHFEIGEKFFGHFEQPIVESGKVEVELELHKSLNQLDAHFRISGEVVLACDRCVLPFSFKIKSEKRLVYTYEAKGVEEEEDFDEVVYIEPKTHLLDVSQEIYDFVCLEIPIRKVPEDCGEDCPNNPLNLLKAQGKIGEVSEEAPVDPRWEALKKLKSDN